MKINPGNSWYAFVPPQRNLSHPVLKSIAHPIAKWLQVHTLRRKIMTQRLQMYSFLYVFHPVSWLSLLRFTYCIRERFIPLTEPKPTHNYPALILPPALNLLFSFLNHNQDMQFRYALFHSSYNSTLVACSDYQIQRMKMN